MNRAPAPAPRWVVVLALVGALLAVPSAQAAPHRADGKLSDWRGEPTMLAGESRVSQGELIHDDWLYDDYGANLDGISNMPVFRSALAPTRRRAGGQHSRSYLVLSGGALARS